MVCWIGNWTSVVFIIRQQQGDNWVLLRMREGFICSRLLQEPIWLLTSCQGYVAAPAVILTVNLI